MRNHEKKRKVSLRQETFRRVFYSHGVRFEEQNAASLGPAQNRSSVGTLEALSH